MLVKAAISWQSVNWPTETAPASQYGVFLPPSTTPSQTVSDIQATVTYDDTLPGVHFLVRPTDGLGNYGPAQCVVIANQPLNTRGWMMSYVRKAVGDRVDTGSGNAAKFADDELREYISDAIRKFSIQFPIERDTSYTLSFQLRTYTLPTDFLHVVEAKYSAADGHFQLYLSDAPYKGGETTALSWIGYPKLGYLAPAMGARLYVGHYAVYLGTLNLDFDPRGDGDTIDLRYQGMRAFPTDDVTPLDITPADTEGLLLYVQGKCWLQLESKDVALSRFRTREDGGRRDDLPTEKMSTRMFNAWEAWLRDRRTQRPRPFRLVRRA
jgi:hypothetical protein